MVPGAGIEPASSPSKAVRPALKRPRIGSPRQVPTPAGRPYKGHRAAGPRGKSPSEAGTRTPDCLPATPAAALFSLVRVLGAIRTLTGQPLRLVPLPLGYEDVEPPSGADPDHPPYEGGAASRARRRGWPSWPRTRKLRVQSAAGLPDSPNGHRVRETRVERASGRF